MGCILTPPLRILAVMPQSLARILVHTVFSTKVRLTTVKEKTDATPFRVDSHTRHTPRVARSAQPWAK